MMDFFHENYNQNTMVKLVDLYGYSNALVYEQI